MKSRAAVAWEAGQPLQIEEVDVAAPKEGEVLVRGPNVMRLYLKNKVATSASLTDEGWLRTGDLGLMDDDGFVFIIGRLKELIINAGA